MFVYVSSTTGCNKFWLWKDLVDVDIESIDSDTLEFLLITLYSIHRCGFSQQNFSSISQIKEESIAVTLAIGQWLLYTKWTE